MAAEIDLACLVADRNIEAAISALLAKRHKSLFIRPISFELVVHPQRDPGCFSDPESLLRGYRHRAKHALIVLDLAWHGAPAGSGEELERRLEEALPVDLQGWALPIVIEPELETWVFSDSPHVATELGWKGRDPQLKQALCDAGLWDSNKAKPEDPKAAAEWALWRANKPRSSRIYRDLAEQVSLKSCQDRSFLRLRDALQTWFPKTDRSRDG